MIGVEFPEVLSSFIVCGWVDVSLNLLVRHCSKLVYKRILSIKDLYIFVALEFIQDVRFELLQPR